MMNNVLSCQKLLFQYSRQPLFSELSFYLPNNHVACLWGENGSGKTTLLKILAGLLKPTSGSVYCFDEEVWPNKKISFEHKSIYLSYKPSFFEELSTVKNIQFYLGCYGEDRPFSQILYTLKYVRLEKHENTLVNQLSSGQKRRLTLAILLLLKPNLVIIDEPTNGLDEHGKNLCLEVFNELRTHQKTSFVVASHDPVLREWANALILMSDYKPVSQPKDKQATSLNLF